MITLYAADSPNVIKIFLALEELELPYKVVPVDVMAGGQFSADFLSLNPNAKVPVITDDEGPDGRPLTVFESGAILIYLAEKTGRFLPEGAAARSEVIQWLMVQMSNVGPMFGQFMHFFRYAPEGNDYALGRYRTQVRRTLDLLEKRLTDVQWLGGDEYSIADIATFPWALPLKHVFGPEIEAEYPNLLQWVARIMARPATSQALAGAEKVTEVTTSPVDGTPQTLDRVFGRGEHTRK